MNVPELKAGPDLNGRKEAFRALEESNIYRNFARDFGQATGLPVSMTPVETWQLVPHPRPHQNPFCTLLAQHSPACGACLRTQDKLAKAAVDSSRTVECVHGLCETAVPIREGENLFGFVRTGQVFRRAPTAEGFRRVLQRLARWGVSLDAGKLRNAYFGTRVISPAQYSSDVGLLDFLARHLAMLGNQMLVQQAHAEIPMVARAKSFIEAHYGEKLALRQVAAAVNASPFHFCKRFKEATGINFTCYVARVRVEKSKVLLLNPHHYVSEVAYAVGFGTTTHFNRMFRRFAGVSPAAYRAQLGTWRNGRAGRAPIRRHHTWAPAEVGERDAQAARHCGTKESAPIQHAVRAVRIQPSAKVVQAFG